MWYHIKSFLSNKSNIGLRQIPPRSLLQYMYQSQCRQMSSTQSILPPPLKKSSTSWQPLVSEDTPMKYKMKTLLSTTLFSSKLCVQRPHSYPPSLLHGGFHSCGRLWRTSIAQVTTWFFSFIRCPLTAFNDPCFQNNEYLGAPRARPPVFKRL